MIQDIAPHEYHLEYLDIEPEEEDSILLFRRNTVLAHEGEALKLPKKGELKAAFQPAAAPLKEASEEPRFSFTYLFCIDEERFFLAHEEGGNSENTETTEEASPAPGFAFVPPFILRRSKPQYLAFAAATGMHLYHWYRNNRFCSRCGKPLVKDAKERMLKCPVCGNVIYPRINPSVIIGVIDRERDRLLVTQYNPNHVSDPNAPNARKEEARRTPSFYALVAGYIEIGESGEMCVKREVMEEVGVRVKNIRYFSSQPWAFSSSFLVGYTCELEGSSELSIQEDELSRAVWISREEMEDRSSDYSLTSAIMEAFRRGEL